MTSSSKNDQGVQVCVQRVLARMVAGGITRKRASLHRSHGHPTFPHLNGHLLMHMNLFAIPSSRSIPGAPVLFISVPRPKRIGVRGPESIPAPVARCRRRMRRAAFVRGTTSSVIGYHETAPRIGDFHLQFIAMYHGCTHVASLEPRPVEMSARFRGHPPKIARMSRLDAHLRSLNKASKTSLLLGRVIRAW